MTSDELKEFLGGIHERCFPVIDARKSDLYCVRVFYEKESRTYEHWVVAHPLSYEPSLAKRSAVNKKISVLPGGQVAWLAHISGAKPAIEQALAWCLKLEMDKASLDTMKDLLRHCSKKNQNDA